MCHDWQSEGRGVDPNADVGEEDAVQTKIYLQKDKQANAGSSAANVQTKGNSNSKQNIIQREESVNKVQTNEVIQKGREGTEHATRTTQIMQIIQTIQGRDKD